MSVPQSPREALPDQLRGVALLGIVLVNMPFLALGSDGLLGQADRGPVDTAVAFAITAFAQGKFYLLFSFLFGYGLTLALRSGRPGGRAAFARRLAGLLVLGALHAIFLFIGDILMSYALLGAVLLWFSTRRTRAALVGAGLAYLTGLALLALVVLAALDGGATAGGLVDDPEAPDAALRGGFLDAAAGRASALPGALLVQVVLNWFPALTMLLLGLAAGRAGVLAHPERHGRLWRVLLVVAAAVGLPAALVSGWLVILVDDPSGLAALAGVALGFGTAPALTGGYVAVVALATRSRVLRVTEAAGRMSLTAYLGESALLSAIFCGWGLGLFGRLGVAASALVAIAVWVALELFARLWLRRFAYGPAEWLLRSWSRLERVPLRRAVPSPRET